jgi:hypothetical protein
LSEVLPVQVCVRDETISGQSLYGLSLEFLSERITVRDLLRERVHHEVREFNRQQDKLIFQGLVQPEDTERTLNGSKLKAHRPLDWVKGTDEVTPGPKALDAARAPLQTGGAFSLL